MTVIKDKHSALKWLRKQPMSDDPDKPGMPIYINIPETEAAEFAVNIEQVQRFLPIHLHFNKDKNQVRFEDDSTLLYLARKGVVFPHHEIYQARIEKGRKIAELCGNDDDLSPEQRAEQITALIQEKADIHARIPHEKDSGLHQLMNLDEPDLTTAKILLDNSLSVNCSNEHGDTPLHLAVSRLVSRPSFLPMIELLLKRHADPDKMNHHKIPVPDSPQMHQILETMAYHTDSHHQIAQKHVLHESPRMLLNKMIQERPDDSALKEAADLFDQYPSRHGKRALDKPTTSMAKS